MLAVDVRQACRGWAERAAREGGTSEWAHAAAASGWAEAAGAAAAWATCLPCQGLAVRGLPSPPSPTHWQQQAAVAVAEAQHAAHASRGGQLSALLGMLRVVLPRPAPRSTTEERVMSSRFFSSTVPAGMDSTIMPAGEVGWGGVGWGGAGRGGAGRGKVCMCHPCPAALKQPCHHCWHSPSTPPAFSACSAAGCGFAPPAAAGCLLAHSTAATSISVSPRPPVLKSSTERVTPGCGSGSFPW